MGEGEYCPPIDGDDWMGCLVRPEDATWERCKYCVNAPQPDFRDCDIKPWASFEGAGRLCGVSREGHRGLIARPGIEVLYKPTEADEPQNWDAAGRDEHFYANTYQTLYEWSDVSLYDPADGWITIHLGPADVQFEPCHDRDDYCPPHAGGDPQWLCRWYVLNTADGGAYKMHCLQPLTIPPEPPGTVYDYPDQNVPRDWRLVPTQHRAIGFVHLNLGSDMNCFPNPAQFCFTGHEECSQGDVDRDWYCNHERAQDTQRLDVHVEVGINDSAHLFGATSDIYPHAYPDDIGIKNQIWAAAGACLSADWEPFGHNILQLYYSPGLNRWDLDRTYDAVAIADIAVLAVATRQRFPATLEVGRIVASLRIDVDQAMWNPNRLIRRWRCMGTIDITVQPRIRLKPEAYDTEIYPCRYPWYRPDDPYDLRFAEPPPEPENPEAPPPPLVETMLERAVPVPLDGGAMIPGEIIWRGVRAPWPYGSYSSLWAEGVYQDSVPADCCEAIYAIDGAEFGAEWDNYDQERATTTGLYIDEQPQRYVGSVIVEVPALHDGDTDGIIEACGVPSETD